MAVQPSKIANNILEFLVDPTVVPVRQRLYFRPEEKLQNESYEGAKADARAAYKDQSKNSDFYPIRNRQQTKMGVNMDRRTMIASMDILSQNFAEDDPIGKDLRTMALAVSKMSDEELAERTAKGKGKAKTFPCPECGSDVLENTKWCVKCKGPVKPGKEAAVEEKKTDSTQLPEEPKADVADVTGSWNKSAAEAVRQGLLAEVIATGDDDDDDEKPVVKANQNSPHPQLESAAPAPVVAPVVAVPEAAPVKEEKPSVEAKSVVNTEVLVASQTYAGVDLGAAMLMEGDLAPLSTEETDRLASVIAGISAEEKTAFDKIFKN